LIAIIIEHIFFKVTIYQKKWKNH